MDWSAEYQTRMSYHKSKEFLAPLKSDDCFLITDKNLKSSYEEEVLANLNYFCIEPGEQSKTLNQVNAILERLLVLNYSRDAIIIGFGGGVVCDLAGFVSAIYKRGCRLVLLPSSLIAMVDASIGGKNGVNSLNYKNQFGTIKQADYINIDFALLESLPVSEIENGMGEVVKHGLISSPAYYQKVKAYNIGSDDNFKTQLAEIIKESVAIKLSFVNGDENDREQRRFLNFGHTLGHVIEKSHHIPHGKAVIWGMMIAMKISYKLNLISEGLFRELSADLDKLNIVTNNMINWSEIANGLLSDKKRVGEKITFILLEGLGKPVIRDLELDLIKYVMLDADENILRKS